MNVELRKTGVSRVSTVLRSVPVSQRHQNMYSDKQESDRSSPRRRQMMFHAARSQRQITSGENGNDANKLDLFLTGVGAGLGSTSHLPTTSQSSRNKLQQQIAYMEKMKSLKRRLELMQDQNLSKIKIGGKQLDIEQKISVNNEINNLKAMVMPEQARWLFHGKGISLHQTHQSVKPIRKPVPVNPPELARVKDKEKNRGRPPHNPLPPIQRRMSRQQQKNKQTNSNTRAISSGSMVGQTEPELSEALRAHTAPKELYDEMSMSGHEPIPIHVVTADDTARAPSRGSQRTLDTDTTDTVISSHRTRRSPSVNSKTSKSKAENEQLVSPVPPATPNPLKGGNPNDLVSDDEADRLRKEFQRLDTDMDGHVQFNQLSRALPKSLTSHQRKYIKQVYDIVEATTFFGIEEFITISYLSRRIANISELAYKAFQHLNFKCLRETILCYVELFQQVDRRNKGYVDFLALRAILSGVYGVELTEEHSVWREITPVVLENSKNLKILKMDFLALMPYFLSKNPNA